MSYAVWTDDGEGTEAKMLNKHQYATLMEAVNMYRLIEQDMAGGKPYVAILVDGKMSIVHKPLPRIFSTMLPRDFVKGYPRVWIEEH